MVKSNVRKSIYNVSFGLFNQIITLSLGIILPKIVLVTIGSESNGLMSSINQALIYLALLEGGIGLTITKSLYDPIAKDNKAEINGVLSAANIFYRRVGFLYMIGVVIVSIAYPLVIKTDINKIYIAIIILITGLPNVINFFFQGKFRTFLQVEGKNYILMNLSTIVFLFTSVSKIILLMNGFDLLSLQVMYLIFNLVQMVYILLYMKKHYSWIDLNVKPLTDHIGQRKSVFWHQISGFVLNNTDMLILSTFCNLKVVSVYSIYNMFYTMIGSFITQFNSGVSFIMGQKFYSDPKLFLKLHDIYEICNMILVFSFSFVLYQCILPFLKLYTQGIHDISYIDKWLPILFAIIQLVRNGRFSSQKVIEYAGEFQNTQWHAVLETVINIVISVIAVINFGLYGVLIGTICALVVRNILMIHYANKKVLNITPWRVYKRWIVNIAIYICLCVIFDNIDFKQSTYLDIIIYAALLLSVSLTTYTISLFFFEKNTFKFILGWLKLRLQKFKIAKLIK